MAKGGGGSIEDKIVSIKFDNAGFEQKISETMSSLDRLTSKLSVMGAGNGFSGIQSAANNVNFASISSGIDNISSKFSAMGAIGFSAIQQITQGLLGFVGNAVKTDILAPIISGGRTRAQEIAQAQFQFEGLGLNTQEVMKNALDAVKGTSFGLGDAAKAAAQFGASGVKAGSEMTSSLRAIGGVAAITGTQFSQMSYLFTQGAAKGHIDNQDLMQFATNGFNAAAAFAKQTGTTEAAVHASAAAGTLDYKTFAAAMDQAFGSHAVDANKTYSGSLDNMHAALSRIGASFFGPELNQQRDLFNALTPVIDKVNSAIQPLIYSLLLMKGSGTTGVIGFLNKLDFTSFKIAIQELSKGLLNIFDFLTQIGRIIQTVFKQVFPQSFGQTLIGITYQFERLTNRLQVSGDTITKIMDIFRGVFSLLDIGWNIIKGVATVLGDLFHALAPAGSGLLNMGASTGNLLTKLDDFLVKGGRMSAFFDTLGHDIAIPVGWIDELAHKLTNFFATGFGNLAVSKVFDQLKGRLSDASAGATQVQSVWDRLKSAFEGVFHVLDEIWSAISNWFHELFHKIAAEMQPADFNSALDAVNVGLLGGITLLLHKFFAGGLKFGFGGGVFNSVKSSLTQVTNSFKLLQTELKAAALMKIAEAIALVAASMVVLSLINSADLTKALAAMVFGFAELAGTLLLLDKVTLTIGGAAKLDLIAGSLIALAAAMVIFALAVKIMSTMKADELAKGLIGVAAGMAILVIGVNAISADTGGLIRAGISIGIIAFALRILANAVKAFADMSWSEMGRGLVGVGVGLAALVLAMNLMPPESALSAIGFTILAVGLRILADAVKAFSNMSWGELVRGLVGVVAALAGIGLAMSFMPADLPITALGVGILAAALGAMAIVLKKMGDIPFGQMAKAIGEVALLLVVLALGMAGMQDSLGGALALIVVSGALTVLSKVLITLSKLSWGDILHGLAAIAGVLLTLGVTALILGPVIPLIESLGLALTLIGAGFLLFGGGAYLAITALVLFSKVGVSSIENLVKAIPQLASAGASLLINFINDLLIGLPTVIKTLRAVIDQLLETVIKEIPKLGKAIEAIILAAFELIKKDFPLLVQAGFLIIQALLDGIEKNIGGIVDKVVEIFVNFSQAVVDNMPKIVEAAANMIIAFLHELTNHSDEVIAAGVGLIVQVILGISGGIDQVVGAVAQLISSFIGALAGAEVQIITAGANMLVSLLYGIASAVGGIVDAVTNIVTTFLTELGNHAIDIVTAGVNLIITLMWGISQQALRLVDSAAQCLLNFLDGLDQAIKTYEPQIISKCIQIGIDILTGIFQGITNVPGLSGITNWLGGLADKVIGWIGDITGRLWGVGNAIISGVWNGIVDRGVQFAKDIAKWIDDHIPKIFKTLLDVGSPSKVMADEVGQFIPLGIIMGIQSKSQEVKDAMGNLANSMVEAFNPNTSTMNAALSAFATGLGDSPEFNPKITPVLDLSKVQAGASNIAKLMDLAPITADISTTNASTLSTSIADALSAAAAAPVTAPASSDVIFSQTINAPAALSTNEIYRNTKSQIVMAKEELGIS